MCKSLLSICFIVTVLSVTLFYGLRVKQRQQWPFPIDMVYLWVDGGDEEWAAKKRYWQEKLQVSDKYAVSPARWRDREELKHSLRSVEKYMPWIHKIYIITDNQTPKWLDTTNPKIKIIDHKEIFPADALPVFNSSAIETRLSFVPGLAEHFIFANDDVFVGKPLSQDFFFTREGKPIVYIDKEAAEKMNKLYAKRKKTKYNVVAFS